jgi:5-formyltetrahydrofolate cyclo-ligase
MVCINQQKTQLRQHYKTQRLAAQDQLVGISQTIVRGIARCIEEYHGHRPFATILSYRACGAEVDVSGLVPLYPSIHWLCPRIVADASEPMLSLHPWDAPLERHPWGMWQPIQASQHVLEHNVDAVLVPGVAFGRDGSRLGQGGGFYDRLLPKFNPDVVVIGVVHPACLLDTVSTVPTDWLMTHLATVDGV